MMLLLLVQAAVAAGFTVETRYASASGPDAWGTLEARADTSVGSVGALLLGGTRTAVLGTFGRTVGIRDVSLTAGALLGMLRTTGDLAGGPTGGVAGSLSVDAPLDVHVAGGGIRGIGIWGEGGVDAPIRGTLALTPRLRIDTWAGDRDPAVRAGLGLAWRGERGFVAASVSAGGRDVVHLGPGFSLTIGRTP